MTKQADHYFKCIVGDEARMFRDTSLEAIGLYVKLRNFSFDSDPLGFLVDHHHRPYDLKRLADAVGERNNRFQNIYGEVRQQRLIQSVTEFTAFMEHVAKRNRRAERKLAIFTGVVGEVWPATPTTLDDVCLVPQLVDQRLETLYGERTGKKGGNPELVKESGGKALVVNHVDNQAEQALVNQVDNPQRSEVRGQRSEVLEREISADAREMKLPTPARFDFLMEQYRRFRSEPSVLEMEAADPAAYAVEFERRLGYTPVEFEALREDMAGVRRQRVSAFVLRLPRQPSKKAQPQLVLFAGGKASA